jgi:hypothetical protein
MSNSMNIQLRRAASLDFPETFIVEMILTRFKLGSMSHILILLLLQRLTEIINFESTVLKVIQFYLSVFYGYIYYELRPLYTPQVRL